MTDCLLEQELRLADAAVGSGGAWHIERCTDELARSGRSGALRRRRASRS